MYNLKHPILFLMTWTAWHFETGNFSHAKQFRSKQKKLTASNNISRNVHTTCTLVLVLLCMKHHKCAKVLCMHWPFTSELLSVAYFR